MRSPLHINHCRFCMCSPCAPWEKAFGKYSSIIEKVLKCNYENSYLFCLPCSVVYIHLQHGKKLLQESLPYKKRTQKSELEMQPEQVHVALPNAVSLLPQLPCPSTQLAGHLLSIAGKQRHCGLKQDNFGQP